MTKRYITERELSDITGRAIQTIRNDRFLRKGFPYIKMMGKSIRYDWDEVVRVMEKSKISFSSLPTIGDDNG